MTTETDLLPDEIYAQNASVGFYYGKFLFGIRGQDLGKYGTKYIRADLVTPPESARGDELREAAQAVVDRWDTPSWKDTEPTAIVINRLRAALAKPEQQKTAEPDAGQLDIKALEDAIEFRREMAEAARKRYNSFYGMNKDRPPMHDVILWEAARAHLESLRGKCTK